MGKRTYSDDDIESIIKEYAPKSEDVDLVIEGLHTRLQRAEGLLREIGERPHETGTMKQRIAHTIGGRHD